MTKVSQRVQARINGEVLDPKEVAEFLKFSTCKVVRLLKNGELPGKKIGNQWRTLKVELDRYLVTETPQDPRPKE
jgi:excisionase family DNA binding protein